MTRRKWTQILLLAVLALLMSNLGLAGTLYVGADVEDFVGGDPAGSGLDRLGVVDTTGAIVNSSSIITTKFLLNGMADAGGRLLTGTPNANTLRYVGFNGSDQGAFGAAIPSNDCCNEEMLFVPTPTGEVLYHAHWSPVLDGVAGIRQLDSTGALIDFDPISEVVGMALINSQIWITRWAPREVGTWDPATNTFTVAFDLDNLPGNFGNAGALAWDPFNDVLWLGTQGGFITPFSLTGTQLGMSYQPFGPMPDTIDGLTFVGEVTVPEPGTMILLGCALLGLVVRRNKRA
jgi:hypothetical protein